MTAKVYVTPKHGVLDVCIAEYQTALKKVYTVPNVPDPR